MHANYKDLWFRVDHSETIDGRFTFIDGHTFMDPNLSTIIPGEGGCTGNDEEVA